MWYEPFVALRFCLQGQSEHLNRNETVLYQSKSNQHFRGETSYSKNIHQTLLRRHQKNRFYIEKASLSFLRSGNTVRQKVLIDNLRSGSLRATLGFTPPNGVCFAADYR